MPRSGVNGTATPPPNTNNQQPLTPISSSMFNAAIDDIYQIFNTPQPISYGGTGGDSVDSAQQNLGLVPGENIPSLEEAKVFARRNRIVNHSMMLSQENGTTAGTANGYYAADQWATYFVTSSGVITSQRVNSVTPEGSPNRYRVTITTPDSTLAAGEYLTISQNLEGTNVADFRYGSAAAVNSVLRFGFRGPSGTYAVALHNSAANRSFVSMFTIAGGQSNTDTVQTISIPGDTSGTWLNAEGVIGITLDIVLSAGSTLQGVGGWQAGNILATSSITNGMASAGSVFELFDVGLRLDPSGTGVYGQYEVGEVHPIYRSERYWWQGNQTNSAYQTASADQLVWAGSTGGAGYDIFSSISWPVLMAKAPIVTRTSMVSLGFQASIIGGNSSTKGYSEIRRADSNANGYFVTSVKANARLS